MVGWVYESNRTKVKAAEDELKAFYLQDSIDDLTNAKNAELELLEERIKNWDSYLQMLSTKYDEFERLERKKLLIQEFGLTSAQEIESLIKNDMEDFTEYMSSHVNDFLNNQIDAYMNFNTTFGTFLDEYKANLEQLRDINTQTVETISADDYLALNDDKAYIDETIEMGVKKKKQTLFEVVDNDKANKGNIFGINDEYYGEGDYVDYEYAAARNIKNGDYAQAAFQLALQKEKIETLSGGKETYDIDAAFERLSKDTQSTTDQIQAFKAAYNNAQTVTDTINMRNAELNEEIYQVESKMAEVTYTFASTFPKELNATQTEQLMQMVENQITTETGLDNLGLSVGNSLEGTAGNIKEKMTANKDEIITELTKIYQQLGYTQAAASAAAASSYSSALETYSGLTTSVNGLSYTDLKAKGYSDSQIHVVYNESGTKQLIATTNSADKNGNYTFKDSGKTYYTSDPTAAKGSHAEGILTGPVTYTGLGMLHGTPTAPEYVLNSDQAYNLLKYFSTKQPEYESNMSNLSSGDTWTLNGNIVLENCDDPAQFWDEVTRAMSNRFNVTKNRK